MTLEDFARFWVDAGKPILPPPDAKVIETDYTLSFPVFRNRGFQVELYLCKPNWTTPKHTHDFDSITVFNGGKMWGRRGQDINENTAWFCLENSDINQIQPILPRGHWHQIRATEQGFSFYNIQYWHEVEPTSATIGYHGEAMGPIHERVINSALK